VLGSWEVIDYRLLGPLEVAVNGHAVDIGGLKQRALLAILLLHANQPVQRDVLIDQLWAGHPPAGAEHAVEVYIWRLRKALESAAGGQCVLTRPGAYLLQAAEEQVDVARFERRAEAGRRALAAEDPGRAAADLGEALALWRGPLLADFRSEPFAQAEIARLEELRAGVVEDRIEADLALGRHASVVSELEALVAVQPLRERLHQQLMIALYRCGRQGDALAVYQKARRMLMADLGIEPGEPLRRLQRGILEQDPSLAPPPITGASQALNLVDGSRSGRPAAATAGAFDSVAERGAPRRSVRIGGKRLLAVFGALALSIALLVVVAGGGRAHLAAGPNTIGVIDGGQDSLSAVVTGVGRPNGIVSGAGAVWITDSADDLLLRVDSAGQVIDRIPVGRGPAGVTVADGLVWVANQLDGTVSEVNPSAGTQVAVITVGIGPTAIASGYGAVWVASVTSDTLSRINAATGEVVSVIPLSSAPTGIAVGAGAVWVVSQETGELLRVDPGDDRPSQAIAIGHSPDGVAVGAGSIWAADTGGTLTRFDPRTGKMQTIRVGGAPAGVVYANGAVWVSDSVSGTVSRIDPATGATQLVRLGNEPTDLAAAGNNMWVTVLPSLASHLGGTLTVIAQLPPDEGARPSTDPAVAYYTWAWQMLSMTNDGLVGYRRVAGLAGDQLVPDLAAALPVPADGGRTYTFRLRPGIRYSTGMLVRPGDFRLAIERVFMIDPQVNPSIAPVYAGIIGATGCERSRGPCNLGRGIVADDATDTVTFHLTAPDPEFLYKLAFPWADAVPPGTPNHQISAAQLPATGPYMTRSLVPGHTWTLVRNPRFRQWSQQAQPGGYPDRIVLRLDVGPGQAVADVEHGRADVLLSPPPDRVGQLATRYASQLHSGPLAATIALTLNTRTAPFDKLAARMAVNDAIDRNTVIALNGGPLAVQATCQILPPAMPGYRPYCPYTIMPDQGGAWTAPNLALAERLVRASGTRGDRVTVLYGSEGTPFPSLATGHYIVSVLEQIGYRAALRTVGPETYFGVLGNSRNGVQAGFFSWYQDYPAPSDFIDPLFTCGSFVPGNPNNLNDAEFCDPLIDAQAQQALALEPANPSAAAGRWAALDRELVDQAPWVPLYNPRDLNVLSARVGNYQFNPYFDLLIDQLWVR
jgi:DNA-binding SARP family transcriptional activator/ABC-type transport system substrate-binding protein